MVGVVLMAYRILIMGLPGSGKTTLSEAMLLRLDQLGHTVTWFNADEIREQFNDWDFSEQGRIRQSQRMHDLSQSALSKYAICDFVCPIPVMREKFQADFTVWVDTISTGRFADTNKLFVPPENYDIRVTTQDAQRWSETIVEKLLVKF
jgi:adenylylsulfate kinase